MLTQDLMSPPTTALSLRGVTKTYGSGHRPVTALRGVSVEIPTQSFTAVMGPSGSGKSTLLQCAAGLDRPDSGTVVVGGTEISAMRTKALTVFRRDHVGFVFQAYNLLPHLSVEQNVTLPLLLSGHDVDRAWLGHILEAVGLADLTRRMPAELSGGQQQRAAIARALVTRPAAVFADEPTGALDSTTGHQVLELLRQTATELGQTVVMVTHDPIAAGYADRVLFLADGEIVGAMDKPDARRVAEHMTTMGGH
ncbi:ABC transporter ATP-binding protein [Nocardioides sp. cx-173]|uniref:ABC transporter ATP-binding protein n=1 Tax=Nocardioides sp. cx-173 TaxID=2898796 RepID=UPI001E65A511|nr:ABC transporter ATP-binding protein [Nocardioides sp. cx-173]MCD4523535.1 ABC transporter ATP-binding protein [Nocardioides sp. cx-173]UGB42127.1 ABC transporter ATP-binding protein [Nocardioides sp. cx-173]